MNHLAARATLPPICTELINTHARAHTRTHAHTHKLLLLTSFQLLINTPCVPLFFRGCVFLEKVNVGQRSPGVSLHSDSRAHKRSPNTWMSLRLSGNNYNLFFFFSPPFFLKKKKKKRAEDRCTGFWLWKHFQKSMQQSFFSFFTKYTSIESQTSGCMGII